MVGDHSHIIIHQALARCSILVCYRSTLTNAITLLHVLRKKRRAMSVSVWSLLPTKLFIMRDSFDCLYVKYCNLIGSRKTLNWLNYLFLLISLWSKPLKVRVSYSAPESHAIHCEILESRKTANVYVNVKLVFCDTYVHMALSSSRDWLTWSCPGFTK